MRASLRRIATLVAKDAAPAEIFAAVAPKSINVFFRLDPATRDIAGVVRFEPGPELVVVGVSKTIEAVCRSRCPARPASSEVTPHLEVALPRGGVVAVGRAAGLPQPRHRLSHGLHAVVPLLVRLGVRLGGEALPHVVQRLICFSRSSVSRSSDRSVRSTSPMTESSSSRSTAALAKALGCSLPG